jgi:hypothetical protein
MSYEPPAGEGLRSARVHAEKPKQFGRRMRRYWKAGRAAQRVAVEQHPADLARVTRTPHVK